MENIKISIITPSFNQGQFIEETIQSVISQNYRNLEYIIMDGGSKDHTVDILKKYNKNISFWVSEPDNGQTHAINKGFRKATGDIITWINSDDVYCEGAFSIVSEYFIKHPECMWVAGNELFMNKDGKVYIRKHPNSSPWLERNGMMSIYQPNIFLRKAVLDNIGYLREDFHMTMDFEWHCRIAKMYPLHLLNFDLAKFRWHTDSKSSQGTSTKAHRRYHEEVLIIISQCHPHLTKFTLEYPKITLFIWFRLEKIMRFLNRLFKGELWKIHDTNIHK